MVQTIQIKRGTRAQIEAAKAAGQLRDGEPYLIIDENRLAVGTSTSGYSSFAKTEELKDENINKEELQSFICKDYSNLKTLVEVVRNGSK